MPGSAFHMVGRGMAPPPAPPLRALPIDAVHHAPEVLLIKTKQQKLRETTRATFVSEIIGLLKHMRFVARSSEIRV